MNNDITQQKAEIIVMKEMIKKCAHVFGWVNTHTEDGEYLELKKVSILHSIKMTPMNYELDKFVVRGDDLYIS